MNPMTDPPPDSAPQARIAELEEAIRTHRGQKADDRCIEDDDRLYAALGDGVPCDRRVGCQLDMVKNCVRFIQQRTEAGGWPTYAELEARALAAEARVASLQGVITHGRAHNDKLLADILALRGRETQAGAERDALRIRVDAVEAVLAKAKAPATHFKLGNPLSLGERVEWAIGLGALDDGDDGCPVQKANRALLDEVARLRALVPSPAL